MANFDTIIYEKIEIPPIPASLAIKALNTETNENLPMSIQINGEHHQTPISIEYPMRTICNIEITVISGMNFIGWSDNSYNKERRIQLDYDKTLIAK